MSTVVERLELLLTGNAKDAVAAIRQTQAAAVDLDSSTGQVQKRMGFLGAAAQTAGSHIQQNIGMYSVAAVGALTAAGISAVNTYTGLADKVRDFSRVSGTTAETSSRLVAIFDDLEISQDKADAGFFKLNRGIQEGTVNLEQYGAKAKVGKDGNLDIYATLLSVADAYKNTSDSGERAALVQEAFGRGGKDLIPILEKGREGIEKMFSAVPNGQILDQGEVDRARQFQLAMDDLKDSVDELKISAGEALVPTLTVLSTGMASTIRGANEMSSAVGGLGNVAKFANESFNPMMFGMNLAGGAMKVLSGDFRDGSEQIVRSAGLIGKGAANLGETIGIFSKGGEETNKFADAQERLAAAQAEVARLAADSSTKHSELTVAKRELSAAENEYEGVARRVAAAIGDETLKITEQIAIAQQYTNAQLGVTGAQLNVEAATKRYNETLFVNGAEALETRQAAQNLEQQYMALGTATYDAAIKSGKSQEEAAAAQVNALAWVAGTMEPGSPLRNFLEDYINRLQGIPRTVSTTLALKQAVQGFMTPGIDANGDPVLETFADGGIVPGAPGARRIIEAHGGEAIFNQDQLRALAAAGMTVGTGGATAAAAGGTVVFALDGQVLGRVSIRAINEAARGGGVIMAEAIIQ